MNLFISNKKTSKLKKFILYIGMSNIYIKKYIRIQNIRTSVKNDYLFLLITINQCPKF
jgi:hypothetical protein